MKNISKKSSKKNSQNNFNIEPLEPRLMMAAHSDILTGAINAIESFDSVTANPAADEVDGLKQQIVGDFNDYKVDVIAAINSIDWNSFTQAEGQSLQDAVGEFVSNKIQSSEINADYTSGILEFSSTKGMNISGVPGIAIPNQVSADASVKLDLAVDTNGDLTASLNNASLNIGNLGAAATFMGISIQEKDISDDNDLVVSVDKANGNNDGIKGVRSTFGFGGYNTTGYSLVGAGLRRPTGEFKDCLGKEMYWYYPGEILVDGEMFVLGSNTSYSDNSIYGPSNFNYTKLEGRSVRCVKSK